MNDLIYTTLPTSKGLALMKLSADGKTREWIAEADREHYEIVFDAITKRLSRSSEQPTTATHSNNEISG